ncbi:MAG TPA: S9 family peptidase, partial [Cyclobacteriaceae bacterium]|nr:S9 family peptidase [Cyclobacteriaceae bacterium]
MKKNFVAILILFLFACSEKETAVTTYTIDQFYKNINVGGGYFSPDETKLLINSNESGIYNVYEIDIASGERKQLTNSTEESYFGQSYFPSDNRFIYYYDEGGNENDVVAMMNPDG